MTVRKAYRKKALETHPDKLSPDASTAHRRAAEAQFHLVSCVCVYVKNPFKSRRCSRFTMRLKHWVIHKGGRYVPFSDRSDMYCTCRQAYDAWGNKLDPNILLEESMERRQDREAWASGLKAEYERRKVMRRQASSVPNPQYRPESGRTSSAPRPKPPPPPPRQQHSVQNIMPGQEQMIEEMLQQVRTQLPPDYEERKRRVLEVRQHWMILTAA